MNILATIPVGLLRAGWLALALLGPGLVQAEPVGFKLTDMKGAQHALDHYRGKWVVVNFWATWCAPCLAEMPDFQAEWKARQGRDLQILGVAMDWDDPAEVRKFAAARGVDYPIVLGSDEIADQFGGAPGLPTTLVYDPSGKLVSTRQGKIERTQLQRLTGH